MPPLEEVVAQLNANVFLREFSFSRTTFKPEPEREIEFADHVVCLDGVWMLFQMKERTGSLDADNLDRWFKRKVLTTATRQIRDTLRYLEEHRSITLVNQRGHTFDVARSPRDQIFKLILYHTCGVATDNAPRFHRSDTAGFIHVLNASDYMNVCHYLFTPAELWEYLTFREEILTRYPDFSDEAALVGQFIAQEFEAPPSGMYRGILARMVERPWEFDLRPLLERFEANIYDRAQGDAAQDYYRILAELGKLTRIELRAFKERYRLSLEAAGSDDLTPPYRFVARTGCGFIFIPIPKAMNSNRRIALNNYTVGAKYVSVRRSTPPPTQRDPRYSAASPRGVGFRRPEYLRRAGAVLSSAAV